MNTIWAVFRKEMLDSFRDRRSLMSLLLFPLMGPVLVSLLLTHAVDRVAGTDDIELPVVGKDHAPALVAFLEEKGIKVVAPPKHIESAVREREVDMVLVIDEDFAKHFREGRPATLQLVIDASRDDARATVNRVTELLQTHARTVGALRLLAHGVSPELSHPLRIDRVDLSTAQKRAAVFLNIIPMFVLLAAFVGGMYTATDATAGERERGSLEPLLITPATRRGLVIGKWLAAVVFASLSVMFTLACSLIALSRVPVHRLGMSLALNPADVAGVLLATIPLTLFVCGLQMLVACFARSFKEAQTYLSLMMLVPMLPAILLMVEPIKSASWMMAIPVLAQQVLLSDMIRGEALQPAGFVLAAVIATLAGLVCVQITAMLFRREGIIYGR